MADDPSDPFPEDSTPLSDLFECPVCGGTFLADAMDPSGICRRCAVAPPPAANPLAAVPVWARSHARLLAIAASAAAIILFLIVAGVLIKNSIARRDIDAVLALRSAADKAVGDQDWRRAVEKYGAMIQLADEKHLTNGPLDSDLADARAALQNARTHAAKLEEDTIQQQEAEDRLQDAADQQAAQAQRNQQATPPSPPSPGSLLPGTPPAPPPPNPQPLPDQSLRAALEQAQQRAADARLRRAAERGARSQRIDAAVATGVAWLYSQQHNGNWESVLAPEPAVITDYDKRWSPRGRQWGGPTSLAVLTLLAAGEKPTDPRLAPALEFLKHAQIQGTYALALRAQVWACLPLTDDVRRLIRRDADALLSLVHRTGPHAGLYGYYFDDPWADHSSSQLAVLGVWALADTGVPEIPRWYWLLVQRAWTTSQYPDGAWSYRNNDPWPDFARHNMAMTASGVATLYITQDYLSADTDCHGNVDNPAIAAGVKWMGDNLPDTWTPRQLAVDFGQIHYYAAYAIERVGQAGGHKYLGDAVDWFSFGADRLTNATDGSAGLADTCFALLFLCHGRAPIMLNKLAYDLDAAGDQPKEADWNQRPRDAAHLAHWTGHATELEFNWQIVNLRVAVDELHDAPILYIAGDQALSFTPAEEAKLKQFCEDGGLIVFNADCASAPFTASVHKLGMRLFPSCEFRALPENHPIYTDEQFKRALWSNPLAVEGLTNGARELMLLFPADDPARFWQTGAYGGHEDRHEIAADLFEYIAGKIWKLRKGDTFIVRPDPSGPGRPIKLARLQYPGMWDPEPAGWRRLAAILHNAGNAELAVDTVNLGDGKLAGYSIAHLTGSYAITLTDAARAELKTFVANGGTLIIDACGGSASFNNSMTNEMSAIFAAPSELPILKPDHPVFAGIARFDYRRYARKIVGKSLATARLRGLEINGRIAVFLSPEDLSLGLVGVPVDGVYGYDPDTATALMTNLLLYAAH